MNQPMRVFAQITKVDEEKRLVYGRAAHEVPDRADEIFDYDSSKPYFEAWSESFKKDTDGKSLGNIRAMHGKVAAGKLVEIEFNDADKAIDIVGKIVDDGEWKKVLEGVYTGYSIGGSYVGEPKYEKVDERQLRRYTANPSEISVVDSPCIPSAKFFEVRKANGETGTVEFKVKAVDPAPVEVRGSDGDVAAFGKALNDSGLTLQDAIDLIAIEALLWTVAELEKREFSTAERKERAKSGHALPDGSFPIDNKSDLKNAIRAYGRAKDKAKAKAHIISRAKALGASDLLPENWTKAGTDPKQAEAIAYSIQRRAKRRRKLYGTVELTKGMWNVQEFAECLECLACVARGAQYDFDAEGDDSDVPRKLRNAVGELVEIFKEMSEEEAEEMLEELKEHAGIGEDDEIEHGLEAARRVGALRKELAGKLSLERASQICKGYAVSLGDMDWQDKVLAAAAKSAPVPDGPDHAAVVAQLAKATERIAALERQPMPRTVMLRTVEQAVARSKEQDNGTGKANGADPQLIDLTEDDLAVAKNLDGTVDYELARRLKLQRLNMAPAT